MTATEWVEEFTGLKVPGGEPTGKDLAAEADALERGAGDLLDEMRVARNFAADSAIYRMVTDGAAGVLRLPAGFGAIAPGGPADLVAIADAGRAPAAALLRAKGPALVWVGGKVKLISATFPQWTSRLQSLNVAGRGRFFVDADVPELRRQVGKDIRLAGRRILP